MTADQRPDSTAEFGWSDEEVTELARENAERLGDVLTEQAIQPLLESLYRQGAVFERGLSEIAGVVAGLTAAVEALDARVAQLESGQ